VEMSFLTCLSIIPSWIHRLYHVSKGQRAMRYSSR
jgi:hypothetical protein